MLVAHATVTRTVPAAFFSSETFDVCVYLGSPVSIDYFERRPFCFDGKTSSVKVYWTWVVLPMKLPSDINDLDSLSADE